MPAPVLTEARQAALLAWSEATRRDLPWRRTRDPWRVLVSELMLQQTQVARVIPKYEAFLERFPTPADCAASAAGEVVTLWAGLGYNRRAVNLHRTAVAVCERYSGALPRTVEELVTLPGIGPYTARAVAAFAYGDDVGVVDTNAARVLARWAGRSLRAAEAQHFADASVPPGEGWAWNQAMLDLGAAVCIRRVPRCDRCPVVRSCAWASSGLSGADPADGSAGVSGGQSRFAGSDRQGRGRLVEALRVGPVVSDAPVLAQVMGWPAEPDRAERVAATLVADGLAVRDDDGVLRLP